MSLAPPPKTAFRLHTVFGAILLFVLLLPLSGAYLFRIYENDLVRQTETELIAQAVFTRAAYKRLLQEGGRLPQEYGLPVAARTPAGAENFRPVLPQLDLRRAKILPPRADGAKPALPAKDFEIRAGKNSNPF